jgi:Flp pilus assembly protein TadG
MRVARRGDRGDRGSAAVEAALVAPALFILLMLVIFAGRVTDAQQQVQSAAHVAARAASQHNDPGEATAAAREAARQNLTDGGITCTPARVRVNAANLQPNGSVTVTVSCRASLGDVAMIHIPARQTFSATVTEVVDRYRGEG